jgi:hypothetical protein
MQRIDPAEQRLVHEDRVAVLGQHRRHLALDSLQGIVRVGAREIVEDRADLLQRAAAALQRRDGVVEGGLGLVGRDGVDGGALLGQRRVEGGAVMGGLDRLEGRDPEGRGPVAEKGVGARVAHGVLR